MDNIEAVLQSCRLSSVSMYEMNICTLSNIIYLLIIDDMQECDYICAPPLMATNKLTDHESDNLQYCMIAGNSFIRKEEDLVKG
ncbi:hypothetical protein T05_1462 [Trichinella murrelli]|uniref:Uncharacterized protein n=1 Tax=Trichinella murrelli TaxID=144512 RepID=A0A0V0T1F1_9BILA|nr:hypothetical protein T05_5766 [Trichinella murrelli]KRX32811.1 hypothetical protein T05_1224 [Trichinella murrelli]KRX32814.1 hypothetical protein T05_1462 [Trichinella murrelli]